MKNALCLIAGLFYIALSLAQTIEISNGYIVCLNDTLHLSPGKTDIYTLMAEKNNENPYFGQNETHYSHLDTCRIKYVLHFDIDEKLLDKPVAMLTIPYIDTYATVYLNSNKVSDSRNAFLIFRNEVSEFLIQKRNELVVEIEPLYDRMLQTDSEKHNILASEKRVMFRKAAFQFGWDWAPRQLAGEMGFPVTIEFSDKKPHLSFVSIQTLRLEGEGAEMLMNIKSEYLKVKDYNISISYGLPERQMEHLHVGTINDTSHNMQYGTDQLRFHIDRASLWYPNGYGSQPLYNATVYLEDNHGKRIDSMETRFAVRSIRLLQDKDSAGREFSFEVNGRRIFAKGANIVPTAMHGERYASMAERIPLVKECNMNMLRVWGGGYYLDKSVYEACDENGILVWQDFPFACALYPDDSAFSSLVQKEAAQNVLLLSSHPSLALWCGNNEIWEGWYNWGWNSQVRDTVLAVRAYEKIFKELLPETVRYYCPSTSYTHSSPLNGWGRKESLTEGDCHYWGVWWGDSVFETYTRKVPRFMSEYGFQSPAKLPTIRKYNTLPYSKDNPDFAIHQKHPRGFELIDRRIRERFGDYDTDEDYIDKAERTACEAYTIAIEAHLRNMPYCMGSLLWQLNEPYPAIGWSCIDMDYNPKATYYAIRDAFEDIVFSVDTFTDADSIFVHVVNTSWNDKACKTDISILNCENEVLFSFREPELRCGQMTSRRFLSLAKKDIRGFNPHECRMRIRYGIKEENEMEMKEKEVFFVYPKDFKCKTSNQ